jgi:peptidoglycan hydrolase CwlO-like protein
MFRACVLALFTALLVLSGGTLGQDAKWKEESKKIVKKDESPTRVKGVLPPNWKKLGLSDSQVQDIYRVQNKHNEEIDKLEARIKELKATRDKEMRAVLTPDQKKRLDEILTSKGK